jgi:hypothetical protein
MCEQDARATASETPALRRVRCARYFVAPVVFMLGSGPWFILKTISVLFAEVKKHAFRFATS